jgi:hypothetical protein
VKLKKIAALAVASVCLSPVSAAVLFSDTILTATLNSSSFAAVLGGGVVAIGGGVYALELERADTGVPAPGNPLWGAANAAAPPAGLLLAASQTSTVLANWSLAAGAGYKIDSLSFSAGGQIVTLGNGTAQNQVTLTSGLLTGTSGLSAASTTGSWSSTTPTISTGGVTVLSSVDLSVLLSAKKAAGGLGTSSIVGYDDAGLAGVTGEVFRGPTLYVTLSPIPEPGEWAMMLAGLSVVGLMVRRRRQV